MSAPGQVEQKTDERQAAQIVPAAALHSHQQLLFNRELSWLEFNRRVLEEAFDRTQPLLERLKFLAIFSTNLDEFFMIRVSGLREQVDEEVSELSPDGLTPAAQLHLISEQLRPILDEQMRCLTEEVLPELAAHDIRVVAYDQLSEAEQHRLDAYFMEHVFPVLTPQAVDASHPFPYISNLSLNLGVMVEPTEEIADPTTLVDPPPPAASAAPHRAFRFARIKVPPVVERLVPADAAKSKFTPLEQIIAANVDVLFPGVSIGRPFIFRVTRDADVEIEEDEADDLLRTMERTLRKRRFGFAVRLEAASNMPDEMVDYLAGSLKLAPDDVFRVDGLLNVPGLMSLYKLDRPKLKDRPLVPAVPAAFTDCESVFDPIGRADVLVHHPYDSFSTVDEFIKQAAHDPEVLAIKITLYRTGQQSPIVQTLMEASERGKQVAALVELKARFDEENNIEWARQLEQAGVHVVYGLRGLKTHCKIALVVRREGTSLRRYVHIGTGNYNPATARLYTDIGLFTADEEIGADATELFNSLTGFSKQQGYRRLLIAPMHLRGRMSELINREIEHHRAGRPARLIFKINSLTDGQMIDLLYQAAQVGVPIDLIVRGVCMLRPALKNLSETIAVRSIVGRFLEHSRIYYFANGGHEDVYIGSADLMRRNLDRRVELLAPIADERIKRRLKSEVLDVYLRDNVKARRLESDGTYTRSQPADGEAAFNSQEYFARLRENEKM